MKKKIKYSDREWNRLAAVLSDEHSDDAGLLERFIDEEGNTTTENWKDLRNMGDNREIDVDKAWNSVFARMQADGIEYQEKTLKADYAFRSVLRIAALAAIIIGFGVLSIWLASPDFLSKKITVATNIDQKNVKIELPDGSSVYLNRNSEFSYRTNFGKKGRNVTLTGEAFFEIAPDKSKPFIIDAGNAKVRVVGTSFNVISKNNESAVEVFVKTGIVELSGNSGKRSIALEPGYIGTMGKGKTGKTINTDPNYLSWNTGLLVYNGQTLDVVLSDLKRVYNMNIVADDKSILANRWTSPIDNQPKETIIRLICASFNLHFTTEGDVYHLTRN
jgi:transmembrane sensor